jgi:dihydroorotate dehydrogenase (fumarate)
MDKFETHYLGINLRNPLVVSSSGLTSSVKKIEKLAEAGAGAVVLKSLFEEQIRMEAGVMINNSDYPEAEDYIMTYARNNAIDEYLSLISQAKEKVDIPVIASINCITSTEWISFAQNIQEAGADAIELNVFILPTNIHDNGSSYEEIYVEILDALRDKITIPVSIKLGQHFSNIPSLVNKLHARGAKGVVLFNRFYAPDIEIDSLTFTAAEVFSSPTDIRYSLRWVGIISSLVPKIDICASTGVHDANGIAKQLLAGARAVQVCSVLYKNGPEYVKQMLSDFGAWMDKHNFENIREFRGRMSYKSIPDPSVFERAQFMKYFSSLQ